MECGGFIKMGYNKSLDFLNMIKNGSEPTPPRTQQTARQTQIPPASPMQQAASQPQSQPQSPTRTSLFAVIDTETNWHDQVMSLGVAIADQSTFKCLETRYYIFEQESRVGGMYSGVMHKCTTSPITASRETALSDLAGYRPSHRPVLPPLSLRR